MATGDFMNNLKKLKVELKRVKYPSELIITEIQSGDSVAYVPVFKYIFVDYNRTLAQDVRNLGLDPLAAAEAAGEDTLRFIEVSYRILRDLFGYKPTLNRDQFVHSGFAERKVMMCTEIVQLVRKRYGGRIATKFPKVSALNNVTDTARPFCGLKVRQISPMKARDDVSALEENGAVGGIAEEFNTEDISFEIYTGIVLPPRTSSPSGSMPNGFPRIDEAVKPLNGVVGDVDNEATLRPFYSRIEVTALLHQMEIENEKKIQDLRKEMHNSLQLENMISNLINLLKEFQKNLEIRKFHRLMAADFIHGDEGIE